MNLSTHTGASATPPPTPWQQGLTIATRLLAWGLIFAILYILRSFFLLIFLTFVFAYIQANGSQRLERWIRCRPLRVALVATALLLVLVVAGLYLFPKVKSQTQIFFNQFGTYMVRVDQELYGLSEAYPFLKDAVPELAQDKSVALAEGKKDMRKSLSLSLLEQFIGLGGEDDSIKNMPQMIDTLKGVSGNVASIASAFFLSLIFSFLIVLDLPILSKSVAELEHTKLKFIYVEVAENLQNFSQVLGRALEAQLLIAIINSVLTALGLYFLGLGTSVAFLSVIVFICSFIPVAGVFISAVPISLIALQTLGVKVMFLTLLWITFIHMIEGYVLN
ncbi:MAG: AI-2E family transporter, partial [Candidatus Methylumidiphilus sp.]